jgi:hypothetical protein
MRKSVFFLMLNLFCLLLFSCGVSAKPEAKPETAVPAGITAILQPGEYPLWFQLAENGLVLLESIDDARNSSALVPWPLASHFRFALAAGEDLLFTVNRDGFYKLSPWKGGTQKPADNESATNAGVAANAAADEKVAANAADAGIALYRYAGGDFWRQYTAGAFFFFDGQPAALLYRDDRFLDSSAPPPDPQVWTFSADSGAASGLEIPAFAAFPASEGWNIDSLRYGGTYWHYRAFRQGNDPEIRMLRSVSLEQEGESVSLGVFQNSALPEPLSAAPPLLRELLAAAFGVSTLHSAGFEQQARGFTQTLSPDFQQPRFFAGGNAGLSAFSRNGNSTASALALAIFPDGKGFCLAGGAAAPAEFSLPVLPEGFVYTWIGLVGRSLFAAWEEQEDYNIGAAGFMVIDRPGQK